MEGGGPQNGSVWGLVSWLYSNRVQRPHGVSIWKNIRIGWDGFTWFTSFKVMVLA